jgi:hypothetical protein
MTYVGEKVQWFFRKGLVIMDDLSRWKKTKKESHCNEWPIQMEKYKDFSEKISL